MWPLTSGAKAPTTSRTAAGKTLTPRTISMSSVRPTQRTRGPVRPHAHGVVLTSTWSRVRKRSSGAARWRRWVSTSSPVAPSRSSQRRAGRGVDQLRVDEAASAEMHAVLLLALAPQRDADVADAHRLGDPRAPAVLELRPERRLAAARLARDQHAPDAGAAQVVPRSRPSIGGVRRRQRGRLGLEQLDRAHQPLAVAGADRDVAEADALERGERGAGDERAGVVGRHDALAGRDAGRRVAAGGAGDPVLDVGGGQRDVARRPGRAARRVDAHDLRRASRRGARRSGSPACTWRRSSSFSSAAARRCRPARRASLRRASFSR